MNKKHSIFAIALFLAIIVPQIYYILYPNGYSLLVDILIFTVVIIGIAILVLSVKQNKEIDSNRLFLDFKDRNKTYTPEELKEKIKNKPRLSSSFWLAMAIIILIGVASAITLTILSTSIKN